MLDIIYQDESIVVCVKPFRVLSTDEPGGMPDRIREGYSLNPETIDSLAQRGVPLIITVDCGITNLDEVPPASS